MINITEQEIMQNWQGDPDTPVVSIRCTAFNHELYIEQTLDGFLMQKTNFPFEVVVHDDCSTDRTAEIIRSYAEKFPHVLKPIYEEENVYSKGPNLLQEIMHSHMHGMYEAICEGDDYWTDPEKLQIQYDLLQKHPEVDMCACGAITVLDGKKEGEIIAKDRECVIPMEDVIMGGGGYFATCGLFFRNDDAEGDYAFHSNMRLDYFRQLKGAIHGGIVFTPRVMCAYRLATSGSWTLRIAEAIDRYSAHIERVNNNLLLFDQETNYQYTDAVHRKIAKNEFEVLKRREDLKGMKDPKYKEFYKALPLKEKLAIRKNQLLHK